MEKVSFWDGCRFANWMQNGQLDTGVQDATTTEDGAYTLNGYTGFDGHTITRNPGARWALPSSDEWHKAAYYKGGSQSAGYWLYPTCSDTLPVAEAPPGRSSNPWSANFENALSGSTIVGAYTESVSPYGTFDQAGNIQECTEGIWYYESRWLREMRGGSYAGSWVYLRNSDFCCGAPNLKQTSRWNIGFRLVYVPEPASAILLLCGGLVLMRRLHIR